MNKLLKKLFDAGKRLNAQWNPWTLRRSLATATNDALKKVSFQQRLSSISAQYALECQTLAERYRAQLMQLRVWQSDEHGRTGWMVSCFIPVESIKRLAQLGEAAQNDFKRLIVNILVQKAMEGIYHVNKAGKLSALVFEPPNLKSTGLIVTPIFEVEPGSFAAIRDCKVFVTEKDLRLLKDARQSLDKAVCTDEADARMLAVWNSLPSEVRKLGDQPPI